MDAAQILAASLALPAEERAALVDALVESLMPGSVSLESSAEIRRRIEAIERGEAKLASWPDIRVRLRARS